MVTTPKVIPKKPDAPVKPAPPVPISAGNQFQNDLFFYTPFDEAAGEKILADVSGNGRNLNTEGVQIAQAGQVGSAVQFAKLGLKSPSLPLGSIPQFAISLWIKPDTVQNRVEGPA